MRMNKTLAASAFGAIFVVTIAHAAFGQDIDAGALSVRDFPQTEFREGGPGGEIRPEKIIGEPNFVPVRDLPASDPNRKLSGKIGQFLAILKNDEGVAPLCTGSLVGPNLYMTNEHCLTGSIADKVKTYVVAMENLGGKGSFPKHSLAAVIDVVKLDRFFDVALLKLSKPLGERYGWLQFERELDAIRAVDRVKIIQHPQGRPKEIVLEDTEMVRHAGKFLHYKADTQGGSSGSPVFALDGEAIIGLHRVGTNSYNEAARGDSIAQLLAPYLPDQDTGPVADGGGESGGDAGVRDGESGAGAAPPRKEEPPAQTDGWQVIN